MSLSFHSSYLWAGTGIVCGAQVGSALADYLIRSRDPSEPMKIGEKNACKLLFGGIYTIIGGMTFCVGNQAMINIRKIDPSVSSYDFILSGSILVIVHLAKSVFL